MEFAIVTTLHLLGFALCLLGSIGKSLVLRRAVLRPAELGWLVALGRMTGLATVLVVLSGLGLLLHAAGPAAGYLARPVFWVKMALFVAASAAVLSTKRPFRAARATGANWVPEGRLRGALLFDLGALVLVGILGLVLAGRIG